MNRCFPHRQMICAVLVTGMLSACAGTRSEPSAEFLAPISDEATDLVGEVHFGLQLAESVQLNHYLDADTPNVEAYTVLWRDLVAAMRAIVYYSVELLDLAEVAAEEDVLEPLIDRIVTLDANIRALPSTQAYLGDLDTAPVFAEMRNAENITLALRAAQPLMTGYADTIKNVLADADEALDGGIIELYDLISETHAPMLDYSEKLSVKQNATLGQLDLVDRAWRADSDAWGELLEGDWVLTSEFGAGAPLTPDSLQRVEKFLIQRLETVATVREKLQPAYLSYQDELAELYAIEDESDASLRLMLLIVDSWERATAQLASGERAGFARFTSSLMKSVYRAAASRIIR